MKQPKQKKADLQLKALDPVIRAAVDHVNFNHTQKRIIFTHGDKVSDLPKAVKDLVKEYQAAGYKVFTQTIIQW